jgi:hypothetical protein|nr:hypothetical protein [uncultured Limnohabitans sp.]
MFSWKTMIFWLLGLFFLIFGGCVALLDSVMDNMCEYSVIEQIPSPSGKWNAVVFQIDCGATTDFNSHVSIVAADVDTFTKNSMPQSFFAIDSNHGLAPQSKNGAPDVRITWKDEHTLEVQHHRFARLIRAETKFKEVHVKYITFR